MHDQAPGITLEMAGNERVLRLSGEFDLSVAWSLRALLCAATEGDAEVVVDLTDLTFIDASGLTPIIEIAERVDGGLHVRCAPRSFTRVVELLDLGHLFHDGAAVAR